MLTKQAKTIIEENLYMNLAITDEDGVWISPVWYAYNGGTFYFISNKDSRHSKAIRNNGNVAISIFNSTLTPDLVNGVQISANCTELNKITDIMKAVKVIYTKKGSELFKYRFQFIKKARSYLEGKFRIYKVVIDKVFILDTSITDDDVRVEVKI